MVFSKYVESIPQVLIEMSQKIESHGGCCYLVGGWVRDALLQVPSKDFDIEVYGIDESQLLSVLSEFGRPSLVGKAFGVYLITINKEDFEFAFPRTETKTGKGHTAFDVQSDPYLDFPTASLRRDFTINSMGVRLPGYELVDPNGGQQDLKDGVLKHVSEAFSEDPLRALRAIQFAARFGLTVHSDTIIKCAEQDLSELSTERFYEEFLKLLFKAHKPSIGLHYLKEMRLVRFFPEFMQFDISYKEGDVWSYLQQIIDGAASVRQEHSKTEEIFMFSALCALMDAKGVESFLKRMTRDIKVIKGVRALTNNYGAVIDGYKKRDTITEGWIRRLALKAPLKEVNRLALKVNNVLFPENATSASEWLRELAEQYGVWDFAPEPLLTGKMLLDLGVVQGPHMGTIIKESFELQLDGILISKEDVTRWVTEKMK